MGLHLTDKLPKTSDYGVHECDMCGATFYSPHGKLCEYCAEWLCDDPCCQADHFDMFHRPPEPGEPL